MISNPVTLSPEQATFAYEAVVRFKEDLEKHATWLKTREGKPLPGQEAAIAEINKEVAQYARLALHIFSEGTKA